MKNMTTKEFCREFLACKEGTRFARKYKTMRECYDALLNGEAGRNSYQWAVWTYVRAADKVDTVRFALWYAKRVRHLMTDKRSTDALDAVQRWLNGERVDLKGFAEAANQAAYAAEAANQAAYAAEAANQAAYAAAEAAETAAEAAETAAYANFAAEAAFYYAAYFAVCYASVSDYADHAAATDYAAAEAAQMEHLRELGNPFKAKANKSYQSYPAYPAYKKEGAK